MNEVLTWMDIKPSDVVVDATVNGGGHAEAISNQLSDTGVFIGIDLDASALQVSEERLRDVSCQCELIHDSFKNIDDVMKGLELEGFDKILFDLGWSSNQFENPERGFSFQVEGPLLMTLSDNPPEENFTAYDIINHWEEPHIVDVLEGYGEEEFAQLIAQAVVRQRKEKPIVSTTELAQLITDTVPAWYRRGKIHPATKTFQALRIAVNNEIEVLKEGLQKSFDFLNTGGRMLVISFHSIEDRIVKNYFKSLDKEFKARILTKKPITASEEERIENRRSRSAKLRVIEKI